jgi:hypothetical protein
MHTTLTGNGTNGKRYRRYSCSKGSYEVVLSEVFGLHEILMMENNNIGDFFEKLLGS